MSEPIHPAGAIAIEDQMSLGIVQEQPTQFDEPFYRYLAAEAKLDFVVYYYGAKPSVAHEDPEIGRRVGWTSAEDRGYRAVFAGGSTPVAFARQVITAGHRLLVISGYNHPHAIYTAIAAKMNGVPAGLRSDNVLPRDGGRERHWMIKRFAYPLLFRLYATAHPVGRQAGEYLMRFGFSKESLFRFPYGVDHRWFARESAKCRTSRIATRAAWGLPEKGPVVCGVMKFSSREDPLTLVKAFKDARRAIPGLSLLLVGDGPLRRTIEEEAGSLLGECIVLPGYQRYDRLPSAYAASDLFVHTASGAWEVSVNEALACGLPVVTSDAVGSAGELVLPNRLGYTFRHGECSELAQRMVSVLNDAELLARVREHGFESLEEWDYPATAHRLISAINFAWRNHAAPGAGVHAA
jgi:glycosyltransferase involved in cell wall biosynthesis